MKETVDFEILGNNMVKVKVTLDGITVEKITTLEERHITAKELAKELILEG